MLDLTAAKIILQRRIKSLPGAVFGIEANTSEYPA
jgi:hypothetical protein